MDSNSENEETEDNNTMFVHKDKLVTSPTNTEVNAFLKAAHFLKPINDQPLSKPPSLSPSFYVKPSIFAKLPHNVLFKGRNVPNNTYKTWVKNLKLTHQRIWKKVGIFDAIRASTYEINKECRLIFMLAHYFCPETNTFVFPWGECSITLEDIMILGGFSVLGDSVIFPGKSENFEEICNELNNSALEISRKNSIHLYFDDWVNYFKGRGDELEHVGFLVLWLSSYVFPVIEGNINPNVFAIAICLAQGTRIALAPAVLATLYRDLRLLKRKLVNIGNPGEGNSVLMLWSPVQLVQLWAWERFPTLRSQPFRLALGEPRVSCWQNVKTVRIGSLCLDMQSSEDRFLWRPYAMDLENWKTPIYYPDKEIWVLLNQETDEALLSYARCLSPCELVGIDCVEQYLPHRVGMQFGMDQDIPNVIPRLNANVELAWSSYNGPLSNLELYLAPRSLQVSVTVQYFKWWRQIAPLQEHRRHAPKRRKRENSVQRKFKKSSNCGQPMLFSSRTCNTVIEIDSSSGDEVNQRESRTCKSTIAQQSEREKRWIRRRMRKVEELSKCGSVNTSRICNKIPNSDSFGTEREISMEESLCQSSMESQPLNSTNIRTCDCMEVDEVSSEYMVADNGSKDFVVSVSQINSEVTGDECSDNGMNDAIKARIYSEVNVNEHSNEGIDDVIEAQINSKLTVKERSDNAGMNYAIEAQINSNVTVKEHSDDGMNNASEAPINAKVTSSEGSGMEQPFQGINNMLCSAAKDDRMKDVMDAADSLSGCNKNCEKIADFPSEPFSCVMGSDLGDINREIHSEHPAALDGLPSEIPLNDMHDAQRFDMPVRNAELEQCQVTEFKSQNQEKHSLHSGSQELDIDTRIDRLERRVFKLMGIK